MKIETAQIPANEAKPSFPVLGKAELVKGKAYLIRNQAIVGETYTLICPICCNHIHTTPSKKGPHIETCPHCDAKLGYNAKVVTNQTTDSGKNKNTEATPTERVNLMSVKNIQKKQGRLVWGLFGRHSASLQVGENIIGRKDGMDPSDISFADDYMSRRSISIVVEKDANRSGYTFNLKVLRAANPVVVNSHQLQVGDCIFLNYGDTIKLGDTVLTFKEK